MILYTINWNQINYTTDKFSENQIMSLTELPGHLSINDWSANKINEVSELFLLLWYSGQFVRHNQSRPGTESYQVESLGCLATSKIESANNVVWDLTPSVTSSSPSISLVMWFRASDLSHSWPCGTDTLLSFLPLACL